MLAQMARFYGWKHEEMLSMPYDIFSSYYTLIGNVTALEQMSMVQVYSYPHMDKKDSKKVWSDLKSRSKANMVGALSRFGDVKASLMRAIKNG